MRACEVEFGSHVEVLNGAVEEFWWDQPTEKSDNGRKRKVEMVAQITTFIERRGFGFLTDSTGEQYFFHV